MAASTARAWRLTSWLLRGARGGRARAWSCVAAAASLALSACVVQPGAGRQGGATVLNPAAEAPAANPAKIAILLPLTGPNAELGRALLRSAQLPFGGPGAAGLLEFDTGGTAEGAAAAARKAVEAGAAVILGPLTAGETGAAAPVARAAMIPVLAFTSDPAQAQPGVWTLGITPVQQVQRLVAAVQADGRTRIAAVLPQNLFGDALAAAFAEQAGVAHLPPPAIVRAPGSFAGFNGAMKTVSDYEHRRSAIEARQKAPDSPAPPPPPMDALFLGASGDLLGQSVPLLAFYDAGPDRVRVLGPATWLREAARQPNLAGAWFAAPDPAARTGFDARYDAAYHAPARELTSIAYDAAGLARAATAGPGRTPVDALTRPEGFVGADGPLLLLPTGQVRRGLAVFEVDKAGVHVVQPAPAVLAPPGT